MDFKRWIKYLAIARTQIINSAAYPLDLATRSVLIVLFMFILMHQVQLHFLAACQSW